MSDFDVCLAFPRSISLTNFSKIVRNSCVSVFLALTTRKSVTEYFFLRAQMSGMHWLSCCRQLLSTRSRLLSRRRLGREASRSWERMRYFQNQEIAFLGGSQQLTTMRQPSALRQNCSAIVLYFSWPAVSQNCALTSLPSTSSPRETQSMASVASSPSAKVPVLSLCRMEVFPTPKHPTTIILISMAALIILKDRLKAKHIASLCGCFA